MPVAIDSPALAATVAAQLDARARALARPAELPVLPGSQREVLRFRAAMGHLDGVPAPMWGLMRSCGPAGLRVGSAS